MKTADIKNKISGYALDSALTDLLAVPAARLEKERVRYTDAADAFVSHYSDMDNVRVFSVGG